VIASLLPLQRRTSLAQLGGIVKRNRAAAWLGPGSPRHVNTLADVFIS
jgi:hypothetical protein